MNLRHLNLSANRLHWFDYAFVPNSLSHLDLHDNLIDSVENYYSLKEGFQLQYLDASQNRFDPNLLLLSWVSSHWLKVYSLTEGFQLQYLDASQNRFDLPIGYNLLLLCSHWLKSILAQGGGFQLQVPGRQSEQVRSYWYNLLLLSSHWLKSTRSRRASSSSTSTPVRTGSILLAIICSCSLLIGWKVYSLKEGFQLQYLDASQNRFDPNWYIICSCSLLIGWKLLVSRRASSSSVWTPVRTGSILLVYICSCSFLIGWKVHTR